MKSFWSILIACLVAGCHSAESVPQPSDYQAAELARPSDPALSEKYSRSCLTCHAVAGSNAPLSQYGPHWAKRLKQGADVLLVHAREGYNSMPARGFCNDCSDEELARLIQFMSSPKEGGHHE